MSFFCSVLKAENKRTYNASPSRDSEGVNNLNSFFFSGVCSLQNKLFVVGGSDPRGQKGLRNCDSFDPVTKMWTSCAPLNISMSIQFYVLK